MRTTQLTKLARKNHTLRESTRSVQIGFSGGKCCNVIDLSRYHFEALRNDDEFILYRGQREEDVSRILVLAPAVEYPRTESLQRV